MAVLPDIVIDCRHPASLARFRAAVLDGWPITPYGEAELTRPEPRALPAALIAGDRAA